MKSPHINHGKVLMELVNDAWNLKIMVDFPQEISAPPMYLNDVSSGYHRISPFIIAIFHYLSLIYPCLNPRKPPYFSWSKIMLNPVESAHVGWCPPLMFVDLKAHEYYCCVYHKHPSINQRIQPQPYLDLAILGTPSCG